MPVWGAGFVSPSGEDYVASRAAGIQARQGRGLYSADPYGPAGQWRDLWAIPLALVNNVADWLIWNANPGTAEDRLYLWEDLLYCSRRRRGLSERQRAAADRLRRAVFYDTPRFALDNRLNRLLSYISDIQDEAIGDPVVSATNFANHARITLRAAMANPRYAQYVAEIENLLVQYLPAWTYYTIFYV